MKVEQCLAYKERNHKVGVEKVSKYHQLKSNYNNCREKIII